MSVPHRRSNGVPISPLELATALRNGLEARREVEAAVPVVPASPKFQAVWPFAGLLGLPTPPARGPLRKCGRLVRQIVKRLMTPWLDHQTRFNHALLTELQATLDQSTVGHLHDTVRRLQDRMNEYAHKLEVLAGSGSSPGRLPDTEDAVEDVFVQTRLPDPPGSALVLSDSWATPAVLASIGYSLLHTAASDLPNLPLKKESFRTILALDRNRVDGQDVWAAGGWPARATLAELLSPGGRVFGSRRTTGEPPSFDDLAKMCDPLRLIDHTRADGVVVWSAAG